MFLRTALELAGISFLIVVATAPAPAQNIVSNFTGYTLFDPGASSGFVPPDTMGAIGPNGFFAEHLNGVYSLYNASTGAVATRVSDTTFWNNALTSAGST